MVIKKEVFELIKKLKSLKVASLEWGKIVDVLQTKYKMTPFNISALFGNPPMLEWTMKNKHLLLEPEYYDLLDFIELVK